MEELQNPFASHQPEEQPAEDMPTWLFRVTVATGLTTVAALVLSVALFMGAWLAWTTPLSDLPPEDIFLLRAMALTAACSVLAFGAVGIATTAGLFARARWAGYAALLFSLLSFASLVLSIPGVVILIGVLDPATQRALDCRLTVWD